MGLFSIRICSGLMDMNRLGWNWALVIRQADSTHQLIRKMLRRGIGPQRVASHDPLVERTTNQLLVDLKGFHGNPKRLVFESVDLFPELISH